MMPIKKSFHLHFFVAYFLITSLSLGSSIASISSYESDLQKNHLPELPWIQFQEKSNDSPSVRLISIDWLAEQDEKSPLTPSEDSPEGHFLIEVAHYNAQTNTLKKISFSFSYKEFLTMIPKELQKNETPEKIADYVRKNFYFETDRQQFGKEDYWQKPAEMLKTKKGDCEDFAVLTQAIFASNSIPSFVLNIYSPKKSHTVVVFEYESKLGLLDMGKIQYLENKTLQDLISHSNSYWDSAAIVSPDEGHQARVQKQIFRNKTTGMAHSLQAIASLILKKDEASHSSHSEIVKMNVDIAGN